MWIKYGQNGILKNFKIQDTEDYDKWITYIEDRPFNDKRYYISNEKINESKKIQVNNNPVLNHSKVIKI